MTPDSDETGHAARNFLNFFEQAEVILLNFHGACAELVSASLTYTPVPLRSCAGFTTLFSSKNIHFLY
jgi:hypothetical protein